MSRVKKNPTGLPGPLTRWATSHRFVGTSPQHKEFMWEEKGGFIVHVLEAG